MKRRADYIQLDKSIENLEKIQAEIDGINMDKADMGESMGPAITEIENISNAFIRIRGSLSLLVKNTCDYLKNVETRMKEDDKITSAKISDK